MNNLTGTHSAPRNHSNYVIPGLYDLSVEDTNWVLTSSFIIFTMQTGFGMLESGCVSIKNEVNIMMKNVIDIVLGGFTYWLFGYGMSFGRGPLSNPFIAIGDFLLDPPVGDALIFTPPPDPACPWCVSSPTCLEMVAILGSCPHPLRRKVPPPEVAAVIRSCACCCRFVEDLARCP